MERTGTHYLILLGMRTAVVKRAVECVVKMPLKPVQKAGDYLRLLG